MKSYFVYAAYDDKYKTVAEACDAKDWVYVGKTPLLPRDTAVTASERVVKEISSEPGKYGQYLHEALVKSGAFHVQHLSTWTPASEHEAEVYPTDAENHWIVMLQAAGGVIKNLAPPKA